jgi:hypothetical protein
MQDISAVLLASLFIIFSLVSLLIADPHLDRTWSAAPRRTTSELEFRYALKR